MGVGSNAELLTNTKGGVLTLTLNRPERKNAFSLELYDNLLAALEAAAYDQSVGAVVLTGAGNTFCAGGDVKRMATQKPQPLEQRAAHLRRRSRITELLHRMSKPTIAKIRGHAVGAGLSVALACDFRIADTSARLSTGFLKAGLPGDFGGHYFLPRLVGLAKARELYFLSAQVPADEALRIGLVNHVADPGELDAYVEAMAQGLAAGPRTAMAYMKANLNQALQSSLDEVLDAEAFRHSRCIETRDHREAVQAFAEKRKPVFNVPEDEQ